MAAWTAAPKATALSGLIDLFGSLPLILLDVSLNIGINEFATDEMLHVEDSVMGVHHDSIHPGIADKQLSTM